MVCSFSLNLAWQEGQWGDILAIETEINIFLLHETFMKYIFLKLFFSFFPVHVVCKSNCNWGSGKESNWVCWINCIQGLRWDSEKSTNYCWTVGDCMSSSCLWSKRCELRQMKAHSFIDFTCGMCMSFMHIHFALVFATMYASLLLHMILIPRVLYLLWACSEGDMEAGAWQALSNFRKYRSASVFLLFLSSWN